MVSQVSDVKQAFAQFSGSVVSVAPSLAPNSIIYKVGISEDYQSIAHLDTEGVKDGFECIAHQPRPDSGGTEGVHGDQAVLTFWRGFPEV
jgi:hypothetical protein